jgi:3-oxoadipate enol-lactonase
MDDPEVIREQAALRENSRGGLAQILTRAYAKDFPERDPERCFLYQQISGLNRHVPANLLPALMAMRHRVDRVVEKRIPTMLLVGEEDALTPAKIMEVMARRIPHSRFVKIAGSGHSAYFEKPREFNAHMTGFLSEAVAKR